MKNNSEYYITDTEYLDDDYTLNQLVVIYKLEKQLERVKKEFQKQNRENNVT
jgi:hypothetical protein